MNEPNKPSQNNQALSDDHCAYLELAKRVGERICDHYAGLKSVEIGPADLDCVYAKWMADESEPKPSDAEVVNGLGVLLGNLMSDRLGFKWMRYLDPNGEGFTSVHPKGWQIYPMDFVWKRVDEGELKGGFFRALHDSMRNELSEYETQQ